MRNEIRLSGFGGQGLILAGIILAEAGMFDGFEVAQTQSYGPEARGGSSKSEVIISDVEIDYPKVSSPNVLLAMSDASCERYVKSVVRDGIVLLDTDYVTDIPLNECRVYQVPLTHISELTTGKKMMANVVALGALNALANIVSEESLSEALARRVPKKTIELNFEALRAGARAAKDLLELKK